MTGTIVPYEGSRAVGLVESYRLGREARQRNAELERLSGRYALDQARENLAAMAQRNASGRRHALAVEEQQYVAQRGALAVSLTAGLVDYTVQAIGGDHVKATYIAPILDVTAAKIRDQI